MTAPRARRRLRSRNGNADHGTVNDAEQSGPDGGTFDVLRERDFFILWLGGFFTFLAVQMQSLARGWLAELITGTNTGLGAVFFGFGVSMLIFTPIGGIATDRFPKRTVLLLGQILLTASATAVGVAVWTDTIEFWMLIAASFAQGVGFSFVGPARVAFSAELVGQARMANAIGLSQFSLNGTRVFGPAVAGVLIGVETVGISGVYMGTAAIAGLSLFLTMQLPPGLPDPDRPKRSPAAELRAGVGYIWKRPELRLVWLVSTLMIMISFPYIAFFPRVANGLFDVGATGLGLMSTATAVGAVVSSLWISTRLGGGQGWRWMTISGVVFASGVAVLSLAPTFPVALVIILGIGTGSAVFQVVFNSLLISESDSDYHGRIQSLSMLAFSGFGLVALPLGLLADAIGLRPTLALMGGVSLALIGWYTLGISAARGLDQASTDHKA